ncbi:hypothetical protein oki361_22400 [Helicobacter pylori]
MPLICLIFSGKINSFKYGKADSLSDFPLNDIYSISSENLNVSQAKLIFTSYFLNLLLSALETTSSLPKDEKVSMPTPLLNQSS